MEVTSSTVRALFEKIRTVTLPAQTCEECGGAKPYREFYDFSCIVGFRLICERGRICRDCLFPQCRKCTRELDLALVHLAVEGRGSGINFSREHRKREKTWRCGVCKQSVQRMVWICERCEHEELEDDFMDKAFWHAKDLPPEGTKEWRARQAPA